MASPGCSQAVRFHEGTLLLLDAFEEPGRVLQWFLRMHSGRSLAGKGSPLELSFEEMAEPWCRGGSPVATHRNSLERSMPW